MRLLGLAATSVLLALGLLWLGLAILYTGGGPGGPGWGRWTLAVLPVAAVGLGWRFHSGGGAVACLATMGLGMLLWTSTIQPSNDRNWAQDQARTPRVEVQGTRVLLRDIRNFRYRSPTDWDAAWYDAAFDTRELVRVWFIVEPFKDFRSAAHTMVSFEFAGNRFVVFSVEVRRERGEAYSVVRGLFRHYELTYVVGDERDLVQLRANHRRDDVFLYPVRAPRERAVEFFLDMVRRLHALHGHPEFYNTLTNNCTTNLVRHLEKVLGERIPYDRRILFPARSDALAYELGLLDTNSDFPTTRERGRINARALAAQDRDDFSRSIREGIPLPP